MLSNLGNILLFLIFKTVHKKTAKEDISPSNKERKPALDNIIFAPDFF